MDGAVDSVQLPSFCGLHAVQQMRLRNMATVEFASFTLHIAVRAITLSKRRLRLLSIAAAATPSSAHRMNGVHVSRGVFLCGMYTCGLFDGQSAVRRRIRPSVGRSVSRIVRRTVFRTHQLRVALKLWACSRYHVV
jgi:hypothetical protein